MILVLDHRDSFTFNIVQALQALGAEVVVARSTELSLPEVERMAPERIVLGPGPGSPDRATLALEILERETPQPVLGLCLGHQALGLAFGARIGRAATLVHGRAVQVEHDGRGLFRGLASPLALARYNSLTVLRDSVPSCLEVSAWSADGDVMGLRHRTRPVEGVQFHPESILSDEGAALFENFLRAERAPA